MIFSPYGKKVYSLLRRFIFPLNLLFNHFSKNVITIITESLRILSRVKIAFGDGPKDPPLTKFEILITQTF